jgi:hypothetical protein
VFVHRLLNIDQKAFEQDMKSGKITIPKEYLQLPGFFGFHAYYTNTPSSERNVEFVIEFMENDKIVYTERKSTNIIRPRVQLSLSPSDITIADNTASMIEQIQFKLINTGSAGIKEININFVSFSSTNLKVGILQEKVTDTYQYSRAAQNKSFNSLNLKGKGHAIVKINAEYTDYKGNIYRDNIGEITIDIRQKIDHEIPINRSAEEHEPPLLVSS